MEEIVSALNRQVNSTIMSKLGYDGVIFDGNIFTEYMTTTTADQYLKGDITKSIVEKVLLNVQGYRLKPLGALSTKVETELYHFMRLMENYSAGEDKRGVLKYSLFQIFDKVIKEKALVYYLTTNIIGNRDLKQKITFQVNHGEGYGESNLSTEIKVIGGKTYLMLSYGEDKVLHSFTINFNLKKFVQTALETRELLPDSLYENMYSALDIKHMNTGEYEENIVG